MGLEFTKQNTTEVYEVKTKYKNYKNKNTRLYLNLLGIDRISHIKFLTFLCTTLARAYVIQLQRQLSV